MKCYRFIFTLVSVSLLYFSNSTLECYGGVLSVETVCNKNFPATSTLPLRDASNENYHIHTRHISSHIVSHANDLRYRLKSVFSSFHREQYFDSHGFAFIPPHDHEKRRVGFSLGLGLGLGLRRSSMFISSTSSNNVDITPSMTPTKLRYKSDDDILYSYEKRRKIRDTIQPKFNSTTIAYPKMTSSHDEIIVKKSNISIEYLETLPSINGDASDSDITYNTTHTLEEIHNIDLILSSSQVMELPPLQRYTYRIAQLLDYNKSHGSLDIPYNYRKDAQLAKWVQSQRYEYKLLLRQQEQERLEEKVEERLYNEKQTTLLQPQIKENASKSNDWEDQQISGIRSYLTPERLDLLNAIEFPWISSTGYYSSKHSVMDDMKYTSKPFGEGRYNGLTTKWMKYWHALKRYQEEHGHVVVPVKHVCSALPSDGSIDPNEGCAEHSSSKDELKLGIWVKNQRKNYNDRKRYYAEKKSQRKSMNVLEEPSFQMTPERIMKLDELGFIWNVKESGATSYNSTWNRRFQELCSFHEENGHFIVQNSCSKYPYLADWTKNQRAFYRNFMKSGSDKSHYPALNSRRIELLNSIGFDWDGQKGIAQLRNDQWWSKFHLLREFQETYGHLDVDHPVKITEGSRDHDNYTIPCEHEVKFEQLCQWIKLQRVEYNRYQKRLRNGDAMASSMRSERIDALEGIGFVWSPREKDWNEMFVQLRDYHSKYGHFSVPTTVSGKCSEDDKFVTQLGRWTRTQRCIYRKYLNGDKLPHFTMERMKALKSIGFMSDVFMLHMTYDANSTIQLQLYDDKKNVVAMKPTSEQMRKVMRSCTKKERQDLWKAQFAMLEKYKQKHGHTIVQHEDDPYLAWWVRMQRKRYRHYVDVNKDKLKVKESHLGKQDAPSSLIQDRVRMLKDIDFIFNVNDYKFNEHLLELKRYQSKYGHMKMSPKKEPHLYSFVKRQRELYRLKMVNETAANALTNERIRILEEVGFVWLPRGEK